MSSPPAGGLPAGRALRRNVRRAAFQSFTRVPSGEPVRTRQVAVCREFQADTSSERSSFGRASVLCVA